MSLDPTLYHFVEENGRTYHKYKQGSKVLPDVPKSAPATPRLTIRLGYFLPNDSVRFRRNHSLRTLENLTPYFRQNRSGSVHLSRLFAISLRMSSANGIVDLQHQLFCITIGSKLNLCPLPKTPKRVLDIATGQKHCSGSFSH